MRVSISTNYTIDLPANTQQELDSEISSFWMAGDDLVLQLSSYHRVEGLQINGETRLSERLIKEGRVSSDKIVLKVHSPDFAGAIFQDEQQWKRLYAYLVWPDLCVFASAISTDRSNDLLGSWAAAAISSIERTG